MIFYNKSSGKCQIRRYISSRQPHPSYSETGVERGEGNLILLKDIKDFSKNWTHIIPGNFGGDYGGILFYDSASKKYRISRMDRNGNMVDLKNSVFSNNWTHITPISFGFRTDLLFYNRTTGSAEVHRVDDQGDLELIKQYSDFAKTWSNIVSIPFENNFKGPILLFYDRAGVGEFYRINGLGDISLILRATNFNPDWTRITVIPNYMQPPIYRIRIHAILATEEKSTNLEDIIRYGKQDLPNVIAGVNRIYREAGIFFEFDPDNDVDIVPSRLLNHDVLPDNYPDPIPLDAATDLNLSECAAAVEQISWRCRGKMALIFREYPRFAAGFSTFYQQEVCLVRAIDDGRFIAEEIGHYLNLEHTFPGGSSKIEELSNKIREWVEGQDEVKNAIASGKPIPENLFEPIVWLNTDVDAQNERDPSYNVLDTPPDVGPNIFWGSTRIISSTENLILFYHGRSGKGVILKLGSDGSLSKLKEYSDFSINWTHVISAKGSLVLYYKAHMGEGVIQRLNSDGTLSTLLDKSNFSRNWTHITAVEGGLLFYYKAHKGEATIQKINENGTLTTLREHSGLAVNYSHIVASQGGLMLLYKADESQDKGEGVTLRLKSDGTLEELHKFSDFRKWTHIVAANKGLILFYKADTGEGVTAKLNTDGTFKNLHVYSNFSRLLTNIISAQNGLMLFYNEYNGNGATLRLLDDGTFETLPGFSNPGLPLDYICNNPLTVAVKFSTGQSRIYVFNPDRKNVMSYFDCPGQQRFSPGQVHVMRRALQHRNRRHLVRPFEFLIKNL